ncbi:hypothetical protein GLAREA_05883 [Glarea lozoyensis ATCC 20868]|uniref:Uncharacterized protein n=1 Tax=Glarea lozoyensis (strain ATCC 20868 / MF5171) TaxID=1116229 RepID=S3DLF8_GLAL2|nr:uncharacterized protein GLAREA_05883 [Glarea lozoyensis ATCC 20868]EPE32871.1 hypothetical protein GLAREA_05883 [Glarea lozoyensis ATCC 20868]
MPYRTKESAPGTPRAYTTPPHPLNLTMGFSNNAKDLLFPVGGLISLPVPLAINIAAAVGVLNSALSAPSVKRIVWTGTIPIAFRPGETYRQDGNTWAGDAVAAAWAPPPYTPERA